MCDHVLILRSNTLEKELEGILDSFGLVGQAVNIDVLNLGLPSNEYRSELLERAHARQINEFRRVVLFVSPPVPSMGDAAKAIEMNHEDFQVMTHLVDPAWMSRMILIQKENADASELWGVLNRPGSKMKPGHVLGRPHGRDSGAQYVRQIAQATLERRDRGNVTKPTTRLSPWLFRKGAKKVVTAAIGLVGTTLIAVLQSIFGFFKETGLLDQ